MEYYGNNDWRDYHLAHYGRKGMKKGKHLPGTEWWKKLPWGKNKPKEQYRTDNEHDVMKLRNTAQYWGNESERSKNELNRHRGTMGTGTDPQSRTLSNQYNTQKGLANRASSESARAEKENAAARKRKAEKANKKETKYMFGIPIKASSSKAKNRDGYNPAHPYSVTFKAPNKKSKTTRKKGNVHKTI